MMKHGDLLVYTVEGSLVLELRTQRKHKPGGHLLPRVLDSLSKKEDEAKCSFINVPRTLRHNDRNILELQILSVQCLNVRRGGCWESRRS